MSITVSVPGKRGKLRLGARENTSGKGDRYPSFKSGDKRRYGLGVLVPETQDDWNAARAAKVRCEAECAEFNPVLGGCYLGLLPEPKCPKLKRRENNDDDRPTPRL